MTAPLPPTVATVAGMFEQAALHHPDQQLRSFFAEQTMTYSEFARRGMAVAVGLVERSVRPGMPVAVLSKSNLGLLPALAGVATAGATIVPLSVSMGLSKAYLARLRQVIDDCEVRVAVVDDRYAEAFGELLPHVRAMTMSSLNGTAARGGGAVDLPVVNEDDLALIQYTSGSTSKPRGVALSHRNVIAGIRAMHDGVRPRENDLLCHWLPLSHDMGLFSTLAAMAAGLEIHMSPPRDFVRFPDEWLRRASDCRASILVGPNLFFQLLIDSIPPASVATYDLSAVRVILNGAEPIDPGLAERFSQHFAEAGLAPEAMTPCYGLAEATLAVTMAPVDRPAAVDWVDRTTLNIQECAAPAPPDGAGARGVVNCGLPVQGVEVRVARAGRALPDRTVGDIQIRGEPVMRGYHREATPFVAPDGWCPTGDLGYLADGCLYVTGRRKEMMILAGRNYYPQDIEDVVRRVPGVHEGHTVAVVLPADPVAGLPERMAVLAETASALSDCAGIVDAIRQKAATALGGASVDVVLLRKNALLRTTSGKYQRLLMRQLLAEGTLAHVVVTAIAGQPVPIAEERSEPSLP